MIVCLIIAILSTLYWIDSLIITVTNAKINPYQKNIEQEKREKQTTILRLSAMLTSSVFWGIIINYYF